MPAPIEIFKPGRHTDMKGVSVTISAADLAASAKAYDPALHEAPIVIGHPKSDAPAYGWVKSLSFADTLNAQPDQLDPAFAEAVRDGHYKKVSSSFYRPDAPSNPKPGVWYLKHVGFLGAAAPAVKGLRQVSFAENDAESVTVDFGDYGDRIFGGLFRGLRDWMIAKFGQEEADKALPPWDVTTVQEIAAQPESSVAPVGFSEENAPVPAPVEPTVEPVAVPPVIAQPAVTPTPDPRETELARREAEISRREAELEEKQRQQQATQLEGRRNEHVAYLEGLVREGRPLPCAAGTIVSFMRLLDGETNEVVSFGESETRSPLELFKSELLANLPKTVEFAELGAGAVHDTSSPEAIAAAATRYQQEQGKAGVNVSVSDAVSHVMKGNS